MQLKKTFLTVSLAIISIVAYSQELKNKKGQNILPEKGNWAIGFDVVPVLKYAGNLFYNGNDSVSDLSQFGNMAFTGKYMLADKKAIRTSVRLGFLSMKSDSLVPKSNSTNSNEKVSDEKKQSITNLSLSGGVEKRKGNGRVNGIYGVEGGLSLQMNKTKYTYGNELDVTIQSNKRITSDKAGTLFAIGIRGFLGVEYFIAAKLALSAEYGWGPQYAFLTRAEQEYEVVDGNTTKTEIVESNKAAGFSFDNDTNGGTVALTFYF